MKAQQIVHPDLIWEAGGSDVVLLSPNENLDRRRFAFPGVESFHRAVADSYRLGAVAHYQSWAPHQRAGRLAEARAQLARAAERFQELGMRSWRARADVALAALG